jgi:hypothetical protein
MTTGRINQVTTDSRLRIARPPGDGRVCHQIRSRPTSTDGQERPAGPPRGRQAHGRDAHGLRSNSTCPEVDVRDARARFKPGHTGSTMRRTATGRATDAPPVTDPQTIQEIFDHGPSIHQSTHSSRPLTRPRAPRSGLLNRGSEARMPFP